MSVYEVSLGIVTSPTITIDGTIIEFLIKISETKHCQSKNLVAEANRRNYEESF